MAADAPYFREAGAGPGVVCLHSNASSSSQWRGLIDRLSPRYHVLAADAYGAGRSPALPADRTLQLDDEVSLLAPVLARAGRPFALVGHSYGGAVAAIAALRHRADVRALALYEPTLFALLDEEKPPPNDADGIRAAVARSVAALAAADPDAASGHFIDYWMGPGTWAGLPDGRRAPITAAIVNIAGWGHALFGDTTRLRQFADLDIPVLCMVGARSPASSLAVARRLTQRLPNVELVTFDDLGHMGPVTDPDRVNETIARFLERTIGGRVDRANAADVR